MFTVVPLGTASATPAYGRHLSATAVEREGELLLFDCGEGTQFQLRAAGLKASRLKAIFITHLHGDHFFGLPGLLSTLGLHQRGGGLTVVGPAGLAEALRALPGLGADQLGYPLDFVTLEAERGPCTVYDHGAYRVTAAPLAHRVPAFGYRLEEDPRSGHLDVERARDLGVTDYAHYRALKAGQAVTLADGSVVQPEAVVGPERPGASFAYVFDTGPCDGARHLAEGATLLYHEATYLEALGEQAAETGHSTAAQAAALACAAGAERLLLGHFSARYASPAPLVEEARRTFKNTEAAEELKRYPL